MKVIGKDTARRLKDPGTVYYLLDYSSTEYISDALNTIRNLIGADIISLSKQTQRADYYLLVSDECHEEDVPRDMFTEREVNLPLVYLNCELGYGCLYTAQTTLENGITVRSRLGGFGNLMYCGNNIKKIVIKPTD